MLEFFQFYCVKTSFTFLGIELYFTTLPGMLGKQILYPNLQPQMHLLVGLCVEIGIVTTLLSVPFLYNLTPYLREVIGVSCHFRVNRSCRYIQMQCNFTQGRFFSNFLCNVQ